MQLELGQHIRSSDEQDIGTIKHLILDPMSGRVKTFVVEKGWLLPDDTEIPVPAVQERGDGQLHIRYTAAEVKQLPRFDESQYTPFTPGQVDPLLNYPPGGLLWPNGFGVSPLYTPVYPYPLSAADGVPATPLRPEVQEAMRQKDERNAVIAAGDEVFSQDGHKVGEVETLAFDSITGRPTHLTLRRGWLFHKEWEVPADAIASVDDGVVTLNLDRARLETGREEERYVTEWGQESRPKSSAS